MTMTDEIPRQASKYVVQGKQGKIEFTGTLIALASSEGPSSQRWTEIEVFRTQAGKYVVHVIGVSLVYHAMDGTGSLCRSGHVTTQAELSRGSEPCKDCHPDRNRSTNRVGRDLKVRRETDRHSVEVVDSADRLSDALTITRQDGTTYLSSVASDALAQSAVKDPAVQAALNKTIHIS